MEKTEPKTAAPSRSKEEIHAELESLNAAHLQNESARESFLALAHTALFAASVSFVGDLESGSGMKALWVLLLGWGASVVGLGALTLSYHESSRHIRKRHSQVYEAACDEPTGLDALNGIALWSFPFALVSTFLFAAVNVGAMSKDRQTPPPPVVPITRGVTPPPRMPNPGFGVTPAPRAPAPPPKPADPPKK